MQLERISDDVAARKTYRYVRLGMIGAVVLLASSILIEQQDTERAGWLTSISAYYYTPVRAVFVGALLGVGLSLIVIKGSIWQEDICLNVAGMLAPVVALVPTSDTDATDVSAASARADIDNNIQALFVTGLVALIVAGGIAAHAAGKRRSQRQPVFTLPAQDRGALAGVAATALLVGAAALWYFHGRENFYEFSHSTAAMTMFAFLAAAAFFNGWDASRCRVPTYPAIYFVVAGLMAAAAGLFLTSWEHKVLWIEGIEIGLFAALWIVQTKELWADTLRRRPADG